MSLANGENVAEHIQDIIHQETQQQANRFDLTVDRVFHVTGPGQLDFGGSEFQPADQSEIEPNKKNPDDDYGWWELDAGSYVIEYNEDLQPASDTTLLLFPLQRLLQAGASHAAFSVSGDTNDVITLLTVGEAGCHLKENCRVTGVVTVE